MGSNKKRVFLIVSLDGVPLAAAAVSAQQTGPLKEPDVGGSARLRSIELTSNKRVQTSQFPLAKASCRARRSWAPVNENHLVLREVIRVGTAVSEELFC